jgi:hypothetical protein
MRKNQVYKHFGSLQAIAAALSITKSAVSQWDAIVPKGAAYELQCITGGALRVDAKLYRHRGRGKSRKAA